MFLDLLLRFYLVLNKEIAVLLHCEYLTSVLFFWKLFQNWKFIALNAEEPIQGFIFGTNCVPEVMKMAYTFRKMPVCREWSGMSLTHLLCSTWSNDHLEMWPCGFALGHCVPLQDTCTRHVADSEPEAWRSVFMKRFELEVIKNNK